MNVGDVAFENGMSGEHGGLFTAHMCTFRSGTNKGLHHRPIGGTEADGSLSSWTGVHLVFGLAFNAYLVSKLCIRSRLKTHG